MKEQHFFLFLSMRKLLFHQFNLLSFVMDLNFDVYNSLLCSLDKYTGRDNIVKEHCCLNMYGNNIVLRFPTFFVHAPSRFTMFMCFPKCTIIFSSEASALIYILSAVFFTIFTATSVVSSAFMIPRASAL